MFADESSFDRASAWPGVSGSVSESVATLFDCDTDTDEHESSAGLERRFGRNTGRSASALASMLERGSENPTLGRDDDQRPSVSGEASLSCQDLEQAST
jgi:hypothetical protein